jgi:5-(hydroxymethyl)furfural/furfural oxidase
VAVRRGGRADHLACQNVFVCAGAIGSPALLMRSGIGPADHLRSVGINPLVDLPGVGQQLQNHSVVNLATSIVAGARQSPQLRTYGLALARLSSGLPGTPPGDLHLQFVAKSGAYSHGDRIGIVGAALYAPVSRGSVTLAAAAAHIAPRVDFRLLHERLDRDRMALAIERALELLDDPDVRRIRQEVFAVVPTSLIRRLNRPSRANRLISSVLSLALDGPAKLRRGVLKFGGDLLTNCAVGSVPPERLLRYVSPLFHPTGTCAMGRNDDPLAVLDAGCRVRGVAGLWIADASIMPSIPRANTCLPVMMIAEHVASLFRGEIC